MKLKYFIQESNKSKNFFKIARTLNTKIDKLEDEVENINLDKMVILDKLVNQLLDRIEKIKVNPDNSFKKFNVDETIKRLNKFKTMFIEFIKQNKDNDFQKDIINQVIEYLSKLIKDINDAVIDINELGDEFDNMVDISDEIAGPSAKKSGISIKIPRGAYQDIKTRKAGVNKTI